MSIVSSVLPSLVNGVSQQAASQRLASQGALQENFLSSLARGLTRRPPTRHVARLAAGVDWSRAALHVIDRDAAERYVAVVAAGGLRVFDLDGVERPVAFPDGLAYLAADDPASAFRLVTVADHSFVLNRTVTAAMTANLAPSRPKEALVNVRQGNYGRRYAIRIDGVERAGLTTPDGGAAAHAAAIDTGAIAADLAAQLIAWTATSGGAGFAVTRIDNAIHIVRASGDFSVAVEDGFDGFAMTVAKDRLQRFTDLPSRAPDGFHVEIVGDETTAFDNYFVAFAKSDAADSAGVWREALAQGAPYRLDAASLPHLLVREADGSFTFRRAAWGERAVGDGESAPGPSFVGRTISDVFFFRNRLGLLADEAVVLSRAGDYFSFWPKTVTAQLDSDPIDVSGAHSRVSLLRHATPFNRSLLLFSDRTQFVLDGGDLLTPSSAAIRAATEFDASLEAAPVAAGRAVFFAAAKGAWASLREYQLEPGFAAEDAAVVTGHVPEYVPAGVFKLAAAPGEDMLVALSRGAPDALFVYAYYWSRDEKLQSSWSVWRFGAEARLLSAEFVAQRLVLVIARPDGVDLEILDLDPGAAGAPAAIHLDRRLDVGGSGAAAVYDAASDRTTVTLPYADAEAVVAARDPDVAGRLLAAERPTPQTLRLAGDQTARALVVGRPYLSRYRFSPFHLRDDLGGGGYALTDGRLQILYCSLAYEASGAFRVRVQPKARPAYVYRFAGRVTGADANRLGRLALESGRFKVPVFARNTEVEITLEADSPAPATVSSAAWEGRYSLRAERRS